MRRFINLVESIQWPDIDGSTISDLYVRLSKYVTFGEWRSPTQFDSLLDEVRQLAPKAAEGQKLYRVIRLTPEQKEAFQHGSLVLQSRKYSSWTSYLGGAHNLAQTKGDDCIIVTHDFPADHIVIDIADFYESNEFTGMDFPEYQKYVRPEQEIIVLNSGPMKITSENAVLFIPPEVSPPMIGDRVFEDEDDDEGLEIADVDFEQPYGARGIFYVTDENDQERTVRSLGRGQWEIVHDQLNESAGHYPISPGMKSRAKEYLLRRWKERARELGRPTPDDLSNSCKFTSMFASIVFGGKMQGNHDHQYVVLKNGDILDLNEDAADTKALGDRAYVHDPIFWNSPDHKASMKSCEPRVNDWVAGFVDELE